MLFRKAFFILVSFSAFVMLGCGSESTTSATERTPGIYHIRLELGNYWAGREDEIYFDFDSTKTTQYINHFKYDASDSIIYNKTYTVENKAMDSLFYYAVKSIRNDRLFVVDKYEAKDVNTMRLEIIANERMLGCSYNNVLKPSLVSPDFAKLVKLINTSVGDPNLVK